MTTPLDILLRLDAKQARRELVETTGDVKALTAESRALDLETGKSATALTALAGGADASGAALAKASSEMSNLAASSGRAATAHARAAAAMAPMAAGVGQLGASASAAAAYTQNLTFQVNDIAMMMAAGQNPFMLMMQQGTQVTQIFGQMRAGGLSIGTALRTSLMSMISPANLVTMAVIGVGAAAAQYFMSAAEDAKTLDDAIDDLESSSKDLGAAMAEAKRGIYDLRAEFGDGADAARQMNIALLELTRLRTEQDLRAAIEGIGDAIDDLASFGVTKISRVAREFNLTEESAYSVAAAMQKFSMADTMDQQVTACPWPCAGIQRR